MQQKFSHFLTIALLLQRQKKILTTLPISHLRVLFSCYYLIHFQLICNKSTFFFFQCQYGLELFGKRKNGTTYKITIENEKLGKN